MQLDQSKIKGQTFSLTGFSKKFRIAKTKSTVKGAIESLGGTIEYQGGKSLIGRETENFHSLHTEGDYIFEGELEDRSYQKDFEYFKDFDLKFYDMMRELLATTNISFSYIRIGVPVTAEQFEKLEKKLKRPIPKAVKEFYSIFGELRVLWKHRHPYTDTGRSASSKVWNMDYHDNHIGSFQILPLRTVLFEKWDNESYCFDVGTELKIFDTSTEYHMVALDVTDEGNPLVYRGEDHGVQFREASPLLFTEYLNLCLGLYGTRDRMQYFHLFGGSAYNKSEKEVAEAIAGKATVDINNEAYIVTKVKEISALVDKAIEDKDYPLAESKAFDLHDLRSTVYDSYMINLQRLKQNGDTFANRISHAVRRGEFDWQAYEKKHKGDPIFESEAYLKVKEDF
jgi:hypothetical protein